MNIEDLMDMIAVDIGKPVRRDYTDWESSRIPALHAKYRKILYFEKLEYERMKAAMMPVLRYKKEYYGGKCEPEVYKKQPFNLKLEGKITKTRIKDGILIPEIIKDELGMYVEADPDVIKLKELLTAQLEKVEYLKDMLEDIRKRSFHISNIINTQRFKHGLDKQKDVIDMSEPED
jgi:ethanolamine utilization cobalamin adenosyltransferase